MNAREAISLSIKALEKSAKEPHGSAAQNKQLTVAQTYAQLAIATTLQALYERETMYDREVEQI